MRLRQLLLVSSTPALLLVLEMYIYLLTLPQCQCGHGGMKITVDPCPYCGVPRCANCDTRRFNSRLNTSNPYPESEDLSYRLPLSTLTYLSRQPNYMPPEIVLQGADTKLNLGLFLPVRTILVGDLAREGEEGEEEKT